MTQLFDEQVLSVGRELVRYRVELEENTVRHHLLCSLCLYIVDDETSELIEIQDLRVGYPGPIEGVGIELVTEIIAEIYFLLAIHQLSHVGAVTVSPDQLCHCPELMSENILS